MMHFAALAFLFLNAQKGMQHLVKHNAANHEMGHFRIVQNRMDADQVLRIRVASEPEMP